jgi:hypothetical protein
VNGSVLSARVTKGDARAALNLHEPRTRNCQHGIALSRRRVGCVRRRQPDSRRSDDATEAVASRTPFDYPLSRLDLSGSKLRPSEIHEKTTLATKLATSPLQVIGDARPNGSVVVSAVDAHAIHAPHEKFSHERIVVRRLRRHGHHDVHLSTRRWRSEQTICVLAEDTSAVTRFGKAVELLELAVPEQLLENAKQPIDRRQDLGLCST